MVQSVVAKYLRKEHVDLNEVASDNDDDKDDVIMSMIKMFTLLKSAQVMH